MFARNLVIIASCAALFAACDSQPTAAPADDAALYASNPGALNRELARVRAATARFHDVEMALAEGYVNPGHCVSLPGAGGMGLHFVKMPLVMDADYEPTEPEVLLYEPQPDGSLRLVAVEYVIVQDAWHGAGNTGLPSFGERAFDVTPASPEAPPTYTLHAWLWRNNRNGVFTPFNPQVTCPVGHTSMAGHDH